MMMENEGASRELEADLEAVVTNDRKKKKTGREPQRGKEGLCGFYKYCHVSCRGAQVMLAGAS